MYRRGAPRGRPPADSAPRCRGTALPARREGRARGGSAKAARYGAGGALLPAPRERGEAVGAPALHGGAVTAAAPARAEGSVGGKETRGREGAQRRRNQPQPRARSAPPLGSSGRSPRPARRRDQLIAHVGAPQEALKGVGTGRRLGAARRAEGGVPCRAVPGQDRARTVPCCCRR